MALPMINPAHPSMLLWGQLMRCKARWMCRLKLRKLVKFGRGAIDGGCAISAATSSYVICDQCVHTVLGSLAQGSNPVFFCIC